MSSFMHPIPAPHDKSSFRSLSSRTDISKRHVSTAPMRLKPSHVRPSQAHMISSSPREKAKQHIKDVTNEHGKTDSPVPREAATPQSPATQPRECSNKHPEQTPELIDRAQETAPLETTVNSRWDTVGDVNSCNNSSNIPQHIPYPSVVSTLPSPEPIVSLWAQQINSIHLPDMP
jgi:hypothetical protein